MTLDALNTWVECYPANDSVRQFSDIQKYFPDAKPGPGGPAERGSGQTRKVTASHHAELSLALYMMNMKPSEDPRSTIEIGCSKASCYWCYHYLLYFNRYLAERRWPLIVSRATHGKKTEGWLLPDGPDAVNHDFLQLVGKEMQEIFNTVPELQRRKSDSRSIGRVISHEDNADFELRVPDID